MLDLVRQFEDQFTKLNLFRIRYFNMTFLLKIALLDQLFDFPELSASAKLTVGGNLQLKASQ